MRSPASYRGKHAGSCDAPAAVGVAAEHAGLLQARVHGLPAEVRAAAGGPAALRRLDRHRGRREGQRVPHVLRKVVGDQMHLGHRPCAARPPRGRLRVGRACEGPATHRDPPLSRTQHLPHGTADCHSCCTTAGSVLGSVTCVWGALQVWLHSVLADWDSTITAERLPGQPRPLSP